MRKIIGIVVALSWSLGGSTAVQAFSNNQTGFYIGPQVGYAVGNVKLKYRDSGVQDLNADQGIYGPVGGLQGGYQKDTGTIVFGGELYMSIGSLKGTINDRQHLLKVNFKRTYGFGAAGKIGAKIQKIVLYGKVAVDYSHFQAKVQDSGNQAKENKRLWGFGPGLGVEGMVSKNLILGAEWTLLSYGNKNFIKHLGTIPITSKFKPMVSEFKLRLCVKLG